MLLVSHSNLPPTPDCNNILQENPKELCGQHNTYSPSCYKCWLMKAHRHPTIKTCPQPRESILPRRLQTPPSYPSTLPKNKRVQDTKHSMIYSLGIPLNIPRGGLLFSRNYMPYFASFPIYPTLPCSSTDFSPQKITP